MSLRPRKPKRKPEATSAAQPALSLRARLDLPLDALASKPKRPKA